jgi:23S rRNA (cytidine1920-2'-O)/16S rRNA (cytidine1409-2'-O)-methyltransferase
LEDFPELVDLITIDVTFTSLNKILPKVREYLKPGGKIIALLKPQYERQDLALRNHGIIPQEKLKEIVNSFSFEKIAESPIKGGSGNTEYLILLT